MNKFLLSTAAALTLGLAVAPRADATAIAYNVTAIVEVTDQNRNNYAYNVGVSGSFTYDTNTRSETNVSIVLTNAHGNGGSTALNASNACSTIYVCEGYSATFAKGQHNFDSAIILYTNNQNLNNDVNTVISGAEFYINNYGTHDRVVSGEFTVAPSNVPEPSSMLLLGTCLAGLGLIRRKAA